MLRLPVARIIPQLNCVDVLARVERNPVVDAFWGMNIQLLAILVFRVSRFLTHTTQIIPNPTSEFIKGLSSQNCQLSLDFLQICLDPPIYIMALWNLKNPEILPMSRDQSSLNHPHVWWEFSGPRFFMFFPVGTALETRYEVFVGWWR